MLFASWDCVFVCGVYLNHRSQTIFSILVLLQQLISEDVLRLLAGSSLCKSQQEDVLTGNKKITC